MPGCNPLLVMAPVPSKGSATLAQFSAPCKVGWRTPKVVRMILCGWHVGPNSVIYSSAQLLRETPQESTDFEIG